jgi:hypothetical protein
MSEEASLRKHAENYRRLAESVSSEATRQVLLNMAQDYQARADRLASENKATLPPKD